MRNFQRAVVALAFAAAVLVPARGQAQDGPPTAQVNEPVSVKGVGISGGIIAGAELSLLVESFIDVKPVWPWIVFPILTAGGGGVGGYYLEQNSTGGSIALLVSSMALLIPTAIAVSIARAYEIEDGAGKGKVVEDDKGEKYSFEADPKPSSKAEGKSTTEVEARPAEGPDEGAEPPKEKPKGGGSAALERRGGDRGKPTPVARGALFSFDLERGALFGVPAIDVKPVAFAADPLSSELRRGVEVRISLVRVDL